MANSKTNKSVIEEFEQRQMRIDLPEFKVGDRLRVHIKISEGGKERIQVFIGDVIRKKRGDIRAAFTVRKVSHGIGVERTFPAAFAADRENRNRAAWPRPAAIACSTSVRVAVKPPVSVRPAGINSGVLLP